MPDRDTVSERSVPEPGDTRGGLLHAGTVGRPHGLDGSFLVKDANSVLLAAGAMLTVDGVTRQIQRRAGTDTRLILRLDGCATRQAAAALHGQKLLFGRGDAPKLAEDEWWAEDLKGLRVYDGSLEVGVVTDLLAFPSCEALEVRRLAVGKPLLVPLVADAVKVIDVAAGRVSIDLKFLGET
ncbi:MAG: ribosome maturation factor RimM [Solirubrobacteraceae bacterium]